MQKLTLKHPTFKNVCPECGSPTRRYPDGDPSLFPDIQCHCCSNNHQVMVHSKTNKVFSVVIPFKELEFCPKCGRADLKVISRQSYSCKDGNVALWIYRCPAEHWIPRRQLVERKLGRSQIELPWEDDEDEL